MTTKVEDGKTPRFDDQETLPDDVAGLTANSAASSGVYGAWTVISADIGDIDKYLGDLICIVQGTLLRSQIQVGIGAGGSEVKIAESHMLFIGTEKEINRVSLGNIRVPAGSRLAFRVKDNNGGALGHRIFIDLRS